MPTTQSRPLKVQPIPGRPGHHRVDSHTHPGHIHVVDLAGRGGNGTCTCIHFAMRCRKNHKEAGAIIPWGDPKPTQCRHIAAALERVDREG